MATLTSLIQKNLIGIYIFLSESIESGIPIGFFHMGMTLNLSEGAIALPVELPGQDLS
jgi:hypothetical protein